MRNENEDELTVKERLLMSLKDKHRNEFGKRVKIYIGTQKVKLPRIECGWVLCNVLYNRIDYRVLACAFRVFHRISWLCFF